MTTKHLGPYEIIGVLGRGGMGTVFKGKHESTGELVAIKALTHSHSDETHFRSRFESEIQALLKLNHPNIVRILSFGQEKGTLFFAMELVEGKSLFHLQREVKKFDWRDVLVIARDVASALRHAHDRGIIHRDLKPGNLMKSDVEGIIKVADFGIAKSFGTSHDTRDNIIGTLDFMSPEQAAGKPVTVRSDLYSLGAVLYTLLAGQPPFAANSIEESLRNLTRVPAPPVRERVPNVPEELEMLIAELMEKKPEDRTPTAFALLKKLDYVEQMLRDSSQAQTAHGNRTSQTAGKGSQAPRPSEPSKSARPPSEGTPFLLGEPENRLDPTNAGDTHQSKVGAGKSGPAKGKRAGGPAPATRLSSETVADTGRPEDEELELAEPVVRQDYFATVTEQQRREYAEAEQRASHSGIGWFPILIALAALLGIGSYATYLALQPRSAQSLYEAIEASATTPERIRSEMGEFLRHYPQDARADKVRGLLELADAQSLFKRLAIRQNFPGERKLSNIEDKFVTVVGQVNQDPAAGIGKLRAFLTLYDDRNQELDEADQAAVDAAKVIMNGVSQRAEQQTYEIRQQITQALERAATNPEEGPDIYRSVIEMYGDLDYAADLIDRAKNQLNSNEGG